MTKRSLVNPQRYQKKISVSTVKNTRSNEAEKGNNKILAEIDYERIRREKKVKSIFDKNTEIDQL